MAGRAGEAIVYVTLSLRILYRASLNTANMVSARYNTEARGKLLGRQVANNSAGNELVYVSESKLNRSIFR